MAYTKLADITWSTSSPKITGSIYYNYQRSGADMQYKVKIVLDKLLYADSAYGYNILATIKLDGATKISAHQIKGNGTYASGGYTYETGWMTVANKTTGTTALSVNIYTTSDPDRINKTYSYSLTVAPAASGIDSAAGINTGNAVCVKWTPKNKDFTFNLTFTIGGTTVKSATGIKPGGTAQYTYDDYIIPHSAVPNATSATVTVTLTTYSGSKKVGEASKTFTAYVPASIKPTAALTVTLVNNNSVINGWNVCVKGYSKLSYTVTASGAYGATIQSCRFTFAGKTVTGSGGVVAVNSAGTFTPSVKVTDSRGRSISVTGDSVYVYDYNAPTIAQLSVQRCDAEGTAQNEGTYVCLQGVFRVGASVGGRNGVTAKCRYRKIGGSWSNYTTIKGTSAVVGGSMPATKTYEMEVTATDRIGETKTVYAIIPTAEVALHLRDGGKGAAFGKYAEKEALECAWDAEFGGDVEIVGTATIKSGAIELNPGGALLSNGGFIDFHYGGSTESYTSRIIENGNGQLNLYAPNGVKINGDPLSPQNVALTVVSGRLTDLNYTARYYPVLGMCFVRIYGVINADLTAGTDYDLISVGSHAPNYSTALATKCGKDVTAAVKSNGVIVLRPMGENIAASGGWGVYISGFWFA